MNLRSVISVAALLALTVVATACGSQENGQGDGGSTAKQVTMDEQQAIKRAEEIIQQGVDGMSPEPTLERTGPTAVGACVARDDHGPDNRVQVTLAYKLTGVPGADAKKLVRHARDSWVNLGYKFNPSDADWSEPFPSVNMRTEQDDFWMEAITGVVDRAKGEGLASLMVTSPCFLPPTESSTSATTDPVVLEAPQTDEPAERRALDHSSRIYDTLRVRSAPTQAGEGLRTVRDLPGISVHHAWSTEPLTEAETVRALARAGAHFEGAGWSVRHVRTGAGAPAVVALHAEEGTVAQVFPSTTGAVRVAVTTPFSRPAATDV
ncbi:hypothetical protein [Streptomyces scopuliridis]|uniref:hypothetical protein n=1 Tax=Streptomyces scopuliridis TaxID=452529 RepID=UPI0036C679D7